MSDQGPQHPPRGRRARGSVDPGSAARGDQPGHGYPPPQYPEMVPGQRTQATPESSRGFREYPAPPGSGGTPSGDSARGTGWSAPPAGPASGNGPRPSPGESSPGYGPPGFTRDPSPGYGRPGPTGESSPGNSWPGVSGEAPRGDGRSGSPGNGAWGYGRAAAPSAATGYARPVPPGEAPGVGWPAEADEPARGPPGGRPPHQEMRPVHGVLPSRVGRPSTTGLARPAR